jgi:hypothetical protein
MVANSTFMHTTLQIMVFSLLPPPRPPSGPSNGGRWQPSPEALAVQEEVLAELLKVGDGPGRGAASASQGLLAGRRTPPIVPLDLPGQRPHCPAPRPGSTLEAA